MYSRAGLLVVFAVACCKAKETRKSFNMDPIDVSAWGLPTDDQYPIAVELDNKNFKSSLLSNGDAWIVVFHKEILQREWSNLAERLRGSVWFAAINVQKNQDLAKIWVPNFLEKDKTEAVAMVFPYGINEKKKIFKTKSADQTSSPIIAESMLISKSFVSFPLFDFSLKNMEVFHKWIVDSYYTSPSPKFTMLCLVEDKISPVMQTAKMYFNNFFSFGIVLKKHVAILRRHFKDVPEPQFYPHYLLLLGREPTKEEFNNGKTGLFFDVFPFNTQKYGNPTDFTAIVKYLFTANEEFRGGLPGRRSDESKKVSEMQSVQIAIRDRLRVGNMIASGTNPKQEL